MSRDEQPPPVFVTGATGCIGSALALRISNAGWRVKALVRDHARAAHLNGLKGVELIAGDLQARAGMIKAMRGCGTVFHLAAMVHAPPGTPASEFRRVNLEGTANVVSAAIESGVENLVFFSTVAVYPQGDQIFDETSPTGPVTEYGATKLRAEQVVLAGSAAGDLPATVLRLPVVYGPRDRGNVSRLFEAVKRGRYLIIGDGENLKSMVAVENVVDAALLVATDQRARGRTYIVTDARPYTQREIAVTIAELLRREPNFARLPLGPALAIGWVADAVTGLTGINLPLSADLVRKLASQTVYSSAKIESELGYWPRISMRQGLAEAIRTRE